MSLVHLHPGADYQPGDVDPLARIADLGRLSENGILKKCNFILFQIHCTKVLLTHNSPTLSPKRAGFSDCSLSWMLMAKRYTRPWISERVVESIGKRC